MTTKSAQERRGSGSRQRSARVSSGDMTGKAGDVTGKSTGKPAGLDLPRSRLPDVTSDNGGINRPSPVFGFFALPFLLSLPSPRPPRPPTYHAHTLTHTTPHNRNTIFLFA